MASESCDDEFKRFSEVEQSICCAFSEIIKVATNRRDQLLSQLRKMKMEYLDKEEDRNKQKCEVQKLVEHTLDVSIHQNVILKIQTDQIKTLEEKLKKFEIPTPIPFPSYKADGLDSILKEIEGLGNLDEIAGEYLLKINPLGNIGNTGNKKEEFANPRGLALDDNQRIYIADYENGRILIFSTKGKFIEQFGKSQLVRPHDIAISENWVFVSDLGLSVICKFSRLNHRFITKTADKEIGCPRGIAVDEDVYVAIKYDNVIAVFNAEMKLSRSIGSGKLNQPCDVKINNNIIFVVDRNEVNSLHTFAKTGELLKSFLKLGKGEGDIYFCFDKYNNILISDYSRSSIKIFNKSGELIQRIESKGRPTGIAVDTSCIIFSGHINVITMY